MPVAGRCGEVSPEHATADHCLSFKKHQREQMIGISSGITVAKLVWLKVFGTGFLVILSLDLLILTCRMAISNLLVKKNRVFEVRVNKRTRKLRKALDDLQELENELNRKIHIQSMIIASISHDVTTPLRSIIYMVGKMGENLRSERFDEIAATAEAIKESTSRVHLLLTNLLDFVKVHIYHRKLHLEEVNLYLIVEEKFKIFKGSNQETSNIFINNLPPNLTVFTSYALLAIIIHNLIDNANKYCRSGIIKVYAKTENGHLKLIISDTGNGFSQSLMDWLNIQKNTPAVNSFEYQGIGLIIVKEASRMINVTLRAENNGGASIALIF